MTREQIAKAAMDYAVENSWYPGETSYESDIKAMEESFADAFRNGAEWRINSVWHDVIERPKQGEHIVVLMENGNFTSWFVTHDIMEVFKKFNVVLWARSSDLLPERKEE